MNIPLAKIYYPTEEQFTDPMTYLESIKEEGEKFGIIKIVPPKTFKPPFCVPKRKKIVKTRKQHLNCVEAGTRLQLYFYHNVTAIMEILSMKPITPRINGALVDLYQLYQCVEKNGGFDNLSAKRETQFKRIANDMKHDSKFTLEIKKIILEILWPYSKLIKTLTTKNGDKDAGDLKLPRKRKISKVNNEKKLKSSTKTPPIACVCCKTKIQQNAVVDYLQPFIDKSKFKCEDCVIREFKLVGYNNTYAFSEDNKTYTLEGFKKKADNFKSEFLKKVKSPNPDKIEKLFWDIVNNHNHDIEVEYGSDLSSATIGSGFPTTSDDKEPTDTDVKYINSYWNLNNLPNHPKSTLKYIKANISGIKVPWVYVGMLFSCFCWHVEDHWSCSINYNHTGDIKTWYGIPQNDADAFEHLFKTNYKALFDNQKDLTHQLVTTINPSIIQASNIDIFKVHQAAGEFVVTFSRSYHAGFNQGFNVAEAVNFCFDDWISIARQAMISYQTDKRTPVFSHDAFILELTQQVLNLTDAQMDSEPSDTQPIHYLSPVAIKHTIRQLNGMKRRGEKFEAFDKAGTTITNYASRSPPLPIDEPNPRHFEVDAREDAVCDACKTICFSGYVKCENHDAPLYACDDHMYDMCDCDSSHKTKYIRYHSHSIARLIKTLTNFNLKLR